MPPHNEQLQPTPFEVASPPEQPKPEQKTSRSWVIPALGGLLLLAVLVVFWLPSQVADQELSTADSAEPTEAAGAGATTTAKTPAPATSDSTPWSDAQAAKLRKEAQDVLAELLEIQFALEERGVSQWAANEFSAAAELAGGGDELYKQRQYLEAKSRYEQALEKLQALEQTIPALVNEQLNIARQGIEDTEPETVASALELASLVEPENAELVELQARAARLPELIPLLSGAQEMETAGDLAVAEQQLKQATAIDPAHQRAAQELSRVSSAYVNQRFNEAMSEGYNHLDQGRYQQARKAFKQASQLQKGSAEAASALQEVATAEQGSRLGSLKRKGQAFEQQEQWQQAVTAYEKAQAIDSNVLFVQQGLQRSRERAQLDKQLRSVIDEPKRLADARVAAASEQLLRDARIIEPQGAVLSGQVIQLEKLLRQAATPIAVTLQSDAETEVIIYKVAKLGRFQEKELTLRPGTYTAKGTRTGYRDVLQRFTLSHDNAPAPVLIRCTEQI